MKCLILILSLMVMAGTATADPRMEVTDNFCHFILDPDNTDNEIFLGGCDGKIAVVEGVATGYVRIVEWMPRQEASALVPKGGVRFTSDDSDAACALVDSNGTQYDSNDWVSKISVNRGKLVYKLYCRNGQQQE